MQIIDMFEILITREALPREALRLFAHDCWHGNEKLSFESEHLPSNTLR